MLTRIPGVAMHLIRSLLPPCQVHLDDDPACCSHRLSGTLIHCRVFLVAQRHPGRLVFFSITTFAGFISSSKLIIQIPVVVHNTGAKPRVIRALRLQGMDVNGKLFHLEAQTFHVKFEPGDTGLDFTHAFSVDGRSVVTKYVRFQTEKVPHLVPGAPAKLVLQGLVDEKDEWQGLKTFDILVGILTADFIVMSNHPGHWKQMTLADGLAHQEAIMHRLYERPISAIE